MDLQDPQDVGLDNARVFINYSGFTIRLQIGSGSKGVFHYKHKPREEDFARRPDHCLEYHFVITDSNKVDHRYPETGRFVTAGFRGCAGNWNPEPPQPDSS
jgi:hypothetical protein